jgi:hypothetical protein
MQLAIAVLHVHSVRRGMRKEKRRSKTMTQKRKRRRKKRRCSPFPRLENRVWYPTC